MKKLWKNKKANSKKKVNNIVLVLIVINIVLICFLVYINPFYVYKNYQFKDNIKDVLTKEEVTLNELIPFEYDSVYFFQPYSTKEQIEKIIGIKSRFIKDNSTDKLGTEIVIIKNNRVISSIFVDLYNDGFVIEGLVYSNKIDYSDNILFKIEQGEHGYFIRQYDISYIESYGEITVTIPSEWIKDDKDALFYYIDDKKDDYFFIKKYKKLSLEDFKDIINDVYTIKSEETYIVNTFNGTLLTGVDEDKNEIHAVMLPIGKNVYVFSLVSNSDNAKFILASILKTVSYDEKTI